MRSLLVFVVFGLLACQVLAWPEHRTVQEFPELKRRSQSQLIEELISRLLEDKRQMQPACAAADDFFCWDTGCNVEVGDFGSAFIEYKPDGDAYKLSIGLEYCCNREGYWDLHVDYVKTVASLSGELPFSSNTFTINGQRFKMTVQNIVTGGDRLRVEGVCVEVN
ncbi:uncharacterized protein LOC110987724 [Acanthaster planci]|uniref:Uncharacterized protein LOC110987724 n=1 Tax=Acanthaster planci TaxID=133434 RepID=A0A8B7ZND9_ACAPL|nr:uncharacterized protein LOC110987724 [Acanthaster planci]XP_022106414.1 uncharacterized protein LOC110987724 [Acanthaster planci]XP_022106415.1 uncharacterized protein LOC110987724 [Acanthaster planci]XP_022106416.1 uncharacterized protein LOC110987724 [Acanthaster planci]XP_022106417.1 uncharacterized protein LOC110987724 [Acanthaster planci]XP_022106418.1 uncharacterized protein LOC110987724 [Acanthaster planci]